MNRDSTFGAAVKALLVIFAPIIALGSAGFLSNQTLNQSGLYQYQLMQQSWPASAPAAWVRTQRRRYDFVKNQLPLPSTPAYGTRGVQSLANSVGIAFHRIVDPVATVLQKVAFAVMWVVWPRFLRWAPWGTLVGVLLVGCGIDAYYTRQKRRHGFVLQRLSRREGAGWLMVLGLVTVGASLVWPEPVYLVIPGMGICAFGLGLFLSASIPVAGS